MEGNIGIYGRGVSHLFAIPLNAGPPRARMYSVWLLLPDITPRDLWDHFEGSASPWCPSGLEQLGRTGGSYADIQQGSVPIFRHSIERWSPTDPNVFKWAVSSR